ncbi:MAG: hypothetical protein OQK13_02530 [Gammaproteobacteria bacterium]|nr:hypothetical protein [Gammaproteobacteria bacterium]
MNTNPLSKQTFIVGGLVSVAVILMAIIYSSPIWWVSLTAPNYPPEAFPDGVRIQFHMNGVFNGCKKIDKVEIVEDEALDCVHEMDTINHYVGMYPIAAGGPVERAFSQFLVAFLAVMLLGFICVNPKVRSVILAGGFAAIFIWMYLTFYGDDGIALENEGYIFAMVNSLDQDASDKEAGSASMDVGSSWLSRIKKELEESGIEVESTEPEEVAVDMSDKERLIESIKITYSKGQGQYSHTEHSEWNGSGNQVMAWHYEKSLSRYFNNPDEIIPMVETLKLAMTVVFWAIAAAMLFLVVMVRRNGGLFYWLLILVPMALPLFFLIEYSAWLWWFGHSLNEMGAFTVKPFMPTVFGQGKVAQFTTHSYPDIGFGLMMLTSFLLAAAALVRRKQFTPKEG